MSEGNIAAGVTDSSGHRRTLLLLLLLLLDLYSAISRVKHESGHCEGAELS